MGPVSASRLWVGAAEETVLVLGSLFWGNERTVMVLCPNLGKRVSVLRNSQFGGIGKETKLCSENFQSEYQKRGGSESFGEGRGDGNGGFPVGFRV